MSDAMSRTELFLTVNTAPATCMKQMSCSCPEQNVSANVLYNPIYLHAPSVNVP
jgi:hypothetical protein